MSIWLITLIAFWTYPILTYFLVRFGQDNNVLRTITLIISTVLLITTLFITVDISTTLIEFDWTLLTIYYFGLYFALWRIVRVKHRLIKILGYVLMTLVFGVGYLLGTIGALGVGFVTADFVPREHNKIDSNLTYKKTGLGNAISDSRGVRVEIYRDYKYLPFIEKRISTNEYYGFVLASYDVVYNYNQATKILYLSLDIPNNEKEKFEWNQEIKIE